MISYERYTELLSKHINRTLTPSEEKDLAKYEAAQPKTGPRCRAAVWSIFQPSRVIHDVEKCAGKLPEVA